MIPLYSNERMMEILCLCLQIVKMGLKDLVKSVHTLIHQYQVTIGRVGKYNKRQQFTIIEI